MKLSTASVEMTILREKFLRGGDGGWGGGGAESGDAFDHVAYSAEGAEGFVGNLDGECFLDLEGDVDLVEGVDVELVEGAGESDGVRRDALRFGDDVDAASGDVVHVFQLPLGYLSTYREARASVKRMIVVWNRSSGGE
jgi:hypothetical protein